MRYLFGFLCVCALVRTSPLSVSAQDAEEGATSEPNLQEPATPSEPAPEEPALQLQLDAAGVDVAPSPLPTPDGYTLEEMELRVKRAGIGMGVSAGVFLAGVVMGAIALSEATPLVCLLDCPPAPEWVAPVGWTGALLTVGGLIGMIVSGKNLSRSQRRLRELKEAHYGRPRRVQWDLAKSRVVF